MFSIVRKLGTSKVVGDFQIVEIECNESSYDPSAIAEVVAEIKKLPISAKIGVVISHRGAVWMHSALAHHFHPTAWVAHKDLRLGAVVVQSHKPGVEVGTVFSLD